MKTGDEVMVKSGSMRGALGELVERSVFMYDCWVVMIYGTRKLVHPWGRKRWSCDDRLHLARR